MSQETSRENCQHLPLRQIFIKGLAHVKKGKRSDGEKELIMSPVSKPICPVALTIPEKTNIHLPTRDREVTTDQNKDSSQVQLDEPTSLLRLLTGVGVRGCLQEHR